MNHATPRMRNFAKYLIVHEGATDDSPLTENQATLGVVEKLRPQLEELMGNTGFRALVMHSMARAKDEIPWLGEPQMNPGGSFQAFEQTTVLTDQGQSSEGGAVMLAWFLGLLGSFIGELLTIQLVIEIWPNLSLNKCFSQEENHEKIH